MRINSAEAERRNLIAIGDDPPVTNCIRAVEAFSIATANDTREFRRHTHAAFAKIRAAVLRGEFRCEVSSTSERVIRHLKFMLDAFGYEAMMRRDGRLATLAIRWDL